MPTKILLALLVVAFSASQGGTPASRSFVIRGAQVADGTGAPLLRADVRVEGDTIAAVGVVTPRAGEAVVDGAGLVLAPGFIDAHNHSTDGLLEGARGDHPGVAGHHHGGRRARTAARRGRSPATSSACAPIRRRSTSWSWPGTPPSARR